MAANTKIEWTDHTVSFWLGCTKVSAGWLDGVHGCVSVDHVLRVPE